MDNKDRFCRKCGQRLQENASFCAFCGTRTDYFTSDVKIAEANSRQPYPLPQAAAPAAAIPASSKNKKSLTPKIILIVVGLMLVAFALRAPAALLFGKSTLARVESVTRVYNRSEDSMDYNYEVAYVYNDGEKQRRSQYDMPRTYNAADLPAKGTLIPVKYIPGAGFLSYPEGIKNTGLGALFTGGLGVGLLILGIKGSSRRS